MTGNYAPASGPSDFWVISSRDGTELGYVHGADIEEATENAVRQRPLGGFRLRRLRTSEVTARLPRRLDHAAQRIVVETARTDRDERAEGCLDGWYDAWSAFTGISTITTAMAARHAAATSDPAGYGHALLAQLGLAATAGEHDGPLP